MRFPDWVDVRALWPLDPAVAHLNHGSFGAVPAPVLAAQAALRDRIAANPMRFFARELPAERERARVAVAAFLGAAPAGLAFVPNATTGVNGILRSIRLDAGDDVVVTDHGYGSVGYAVAVACQAAGARVVTARIPLAATSAEIAATVGAALTARTTLLVVDHVSSPTARLFPVAEVIAMARSQSVPVLVDGAHAPGMLPVDLETLVPDFWVGNLHKWVCAPHGAAVVYAAAAHRPAMRSVVVSWGEPAGFPQSYGDIGTVDQSAWLAAPAAIELLAGLGWDRVRAHNAALAGYGQRVVAAALGLPVADLAGDPGVCMRVVPLPGGVATTDETAIALRNAIADTLGVEVVVNAWNGSGLLRLSAHVYNQAVDYERLAAGLPGLLDQVRRR